MLFRFSVFLFSSRRRHTRFDCDWSSDVCSSDLTRRRGSTARRPASTSLHCVPRTAHAKKATVTARPRIQAQREGEGEADARLGAGLEGEGNEVADFVDERAELVARRSEEHTSELQSQSNLVCRLLLE